MSIWGKQKSRPVVQNSLPVPPISEHARLLIAAFELAVDLAEHATTTADARVGAVQLNNARVLLHGYIAKLEGRPAAPRLSTVPEGSQGSDDGPWDVMIIGGPWGGAEGTTT